MGTVSYKTDKVSSNVSELVRALGGWKGSNLLPCHSGFVLKNSRVQFQHLHHGLEGYSRGPIWPKYGAGIEKTMNILRGFGIWLLPGKRDSPKFGHGMRDFSPIFWEFGKSSRPRPSGQSHWCLLSNQTRQCAFRRRLRQIIDLLPTDKSWYFAQPRPIIFNCLFYLFIYLFIYLSAFYLFICLFSYLFV